MDHAGATARIRDLGIVPFLVLPTTAVVGCGGGEGTAPTASHDELAQYLDASPELKELSEEEISP